MAEPEEGKRRQVWTCLDKFGQVWTQHHLITINQLNARVSFLQDQVSTLTFYYTQESHAARATKLQLQNISHHQQQQLQPQQQQQQPAVLQQHDDPLKLQ